MSRTTRTPSPEAAQPADAPGDIALPARKDLPAVAALLSLVTAMLAVARFPSSPMPVALTDRLSAAQQEFAAALEGPDEALARARALQPQGVPGRLARAGDAQARSAR